MKMKYIKKNYYKIITFIILISFLYIFEIYLFSKTKNFEYLKKKFIDKNLISHNFIKDFIKKDQIHLTTFQDTSIKVYCDKNKTLSTNFDKFGFLNENDNWKKLNENLILKTYSEINCNDFNLSNSKKFLLKSKNNLDIGSISSGPIHQYALLNEYFDNINAKKALWLHFEGSDLSDLNNLENEKLNNYFQNSSYRKNLSKFSSNKKNLEVRKHLKKFDYSILKKELRNIIFLYQTRNLIKIKNKNYTNSNIIKKFNYNEIDELAEILNKTNTMLKRNNVEFIFFFMPREGELDNVGKNEEIKNFLFKKLDKNNIKYFDLTDEIYTKSDNEIYLDNLIF